MVIDAKPEIISHNVETVPRLFRRVQPDNWDVSLDLFSKAREIDPQIIIKSGIMVGLGETRDEIIEVMHALHERDVDILTIGQYLPPSKRHFPLQRYYTPTSSENLRDRRGDRLRARRVRPDGPSYHAGDQADALRLNRLRAAKQARSEYGLYAAPPPAGRCMHRSYAS